ncbi:MAG: hypothetical protein OEZ11_14870 [Gammaproteobacteria bacterium]|nr:hypothetical protein [Gammaproteobacteria bacterium]
MSDNDIILCIVPSLVAQLLRAEQDKGAPLTEDEVLQIRDESDCIAMDPHAHRAVVEERGYEDIDPERCWDQWQVVRESF